MSETYRASDANRITREYLDRILIEERLLDADEPDISMELFGKKFSTPIMTPAFSHLPVYAEGRLRGDIEYSQAMTNLNACNWIGMCENPTYGELAEAHPGTIRIAKPSATRDRLYDQLNYAKSHGALAVGIDIDHTFGSDGKYDIVCDELMIRQTKNDLEEYVKAMGIPFIVKGVLSVQDAVKCAEAGVKGIVVSHHHGRLPFAIPPLMVLPEIAKEVGGHVKIFVDCHMDTGADAYKALALGADAVSVGRAFLPALEKDGVKGVEDYITAMNKELAYIMAFTACKKLDEIKPSVLWDKFTGKRLG